MEYLFWFFLLFLAIQRVAELIHARKNEYLLKQKGAVEYDSRGYLVIVAMHFLFFISLIIENIYADRGFNRLSLLFFIVFIAAQILRYWAISSLGKFWNTKILVLHEESLVTKGPYRYIKHPNYIAVITEMAAIPLIFSCYITAFIFSVLNFLLLLRRIRIEEEALGMER